MNLPSPEMKKPWPFALKCPVSSKTETIMTAGRIDCATSAKSFVGAGEDCAEGATIDWTGTEDAGDGEGSGARAAEFLRSHETKAHKARRE
jgi:hypothetical protein